MGLLYTCSQAASKYSPEGQRLLHRWQQMPSIRQLPRQPNQALIESNGFQIGVCLHISQLPKSEHWVAIIL